MFLHKFYMLDLFVVVSIVYSFSPDTSSFDAYGLKLAANDILLVQSLPSASSFFLRLAPYNYSLFCKIVYNDSNQYVFAVALSSQATYNNSIRFVFIGVDTKTDVPFIGSLTYTGVTGDRYVTTVKPLPKTGFPCTGWQANNYRVHQFEQFVNGSANESINNDFFVVTVGPTGQFAYAFTKSFLVVYDLDQDIVFTQFGNATWPNTSFLPHAVDVSQNLLFVVVGYVGNSNTNYIPCAYLLNISNSTFNVLDTWLYTPPTKTSWQASLTNSDADVYAAKYDMSVSMNDTGNQVLLGIQIVNSIVILDIDRTMQKFGSSSTRSPPNGKSIGMGKAVAWVNINLILVLVNTYSFSYTWSSSQIFKYNVSVTNSLDVVSIFPNIQQSLTNTFGPILLSFVFTRDGTVVMLDSDGNYYILLPSPAGSFSDSSSGTSSSSSPCGAGTYSPNVDVFPCFLCPPGTTTGSRSGQSSCMPCANDSFCPLGAAFGDISMSSSFFTSVHQVGAYPVSPQSTRFDNILMKNVLKISNSNRRHCLLVSPAFWMIIFILFGIFVWIIMFIFKYCVMSPIGKKIYHRMERILKKTDLIGEGEVVVGGLFSFPILVLLVFAYVFSNSYFYRYPIEQVKGPSNFACDPTLMNAQFTTGLMPIGIPPNDEEAPIFTLLDHQPFTLHIDLINTVFNRTDATVTQIKGTEIPMTISSYDDTANSASFSCPLPSHDIRVKIQLTGLNTIGGLRIGLEGNSKNKENSTLNTAYTLINLTFSQSLFNTSRLLTQQSSCTLQLTKVINKTYSLIEDDETQFSGVWLPAFIGTLDQTFVDDNEYQYSTSANIIILITISETSYYVLNTQKPITDKDELIFTNLLFTIVCLEIFGLGFLIVKLIIAPFFKRLLTGFRRLCATENPRKSNDDLPEEIVTRM